MIFLIKNNNYYKTLLKNINNFFHINNNNKTNISIKNLQDIIENNLYENIFFDMPLYMDFIKNINFNKFSNLNIYIFINNLSNINKSLLIKSKIIMEEINSYVIYYSEIEKFLINKNHIINIPNELQLGALRAYLINIMKEIKNKNFLKKFVNEINNVFFYNDRKTQFQMLYIINEEMQFFSK